MRENINHLVSGTKVRENIKRWKIFWGLAYLCCLAIATFFYLFDVQAFFVTDLFSAAGLISSIPVMFFGGSWLGFVLLIVVSGDGYFHLFIPIIALLGIFETITHVIYGRWVFGKYRHFGLKYFLPIKLALYIVALWTGHHYYQSISEALSAFFRVLL